MGEISVNRQQEAELQQRIKKGIQFPEELFKMAEQTGRTIPDYQRLKEHRQKGWPLLKADIASLEAIANGRKIEEPRRPSSTVRIERPAKKKRSTATKAEANAKQAARDRLAKMLRRYNGLVASGESLGVMENERDRRWMHIAETVLNDAEATTRALSSQANKIETKIERIEERLLRRQERYY